MAVTINGTTGIETNTDTGKVKVGADDDLQIYHSGSANVIAGRHASADLYIQTNNDIYFEQVASDGTGAENLAKFAGDGAVSLYHDNTKTFETIQGGIDVSAGEGQSCYLYMNSDEGDDNGDKWQLKIDNGDQAFMLKNYASGSWETNIECNGNGNVELYYDNVKMFYTTQYGATVYRPSGGQTQFDVIGGEGEDAALRLLADDGDDGADYWQLKSATNGNFYLQNYAGGAWETNIKASGNGNVELYYNNTKTFETADNGYCHLLGSNDVRLTLNDEGTEGTNGSNWIRGQAGNMLYNSASNEHRWEVGGTQRLVLSSGGELSGNLNDTSDEKRKKNITSIPDGAIAKIKQLRPVNFNWKDTSITADQSGFIAQEVKTVIPDLVVGEEYHEINNRLGYAINTSGVVAHLTKALQEAITKIETLETEVNTLKTKVAALEAA